MSGGKIGGRNCSPRHRVGSRIRTTGSSGDSASAGGSSISGDSSDRKGESLINGGRNENSFDGGDGDVGSIENNTGTSWVSVIGRNGPLIDICCPCRVSGRNCGGIDQSGSSVDGNGDSTGSAGSRSGGVNEMTGAGTSRNGFGRIPGTAGSPGNGDIGGGYAIKIPTTERDRSSSIWGTIIATTSRIRNSDTNVAVSRNLASESEGDGNGTGLSGIDILTSGRPNGERGVQGKGVGVDNPSNSSTAVDANGNAVIGKKVAGIVVRVTRSGNINSGVGGSVGAGSLGKVGETRVT